MKNGNMFRTTCIFGICVELLIKWLNLLFYGINIIMSVVKEKFTKGNLYYNESDFKGLRRIKERHVYYD
jgi:hypothetical protein